MTLPPLGPDGDRSDGRNAGHDPRDPRQVRFAGQPSWLRTALTFVIVLFTCTLAAAFTGRIIGFEAGDTTAAIVVVLVGLATTVAVMFYLSRRR